MLAILQYLNTLTPLGLAGLLALVLWKMASRKQVTAMSDNHLSGVAETLQRIEVKLGEEFAYIRAKLNGRV